MSLLKGEGRTSMIPIHDKGERNLGEAVLSIKHKGALTQMPT